METDDLNIGGLEQRKDIAGLIEALKHPKEGVRMRAAHALERIGDERAIPALTAALHDTAATDPAEYFRGNQAWEETGSDETIYFVRNAARDALKMIWSRSVTTFEEPLPGARPFEVGDIVAQWRQPDSVMKGARWKVLSITRNEVALELVDGLYEDGDAFHKKLNFPGFVVRISSSVDYRHKYPGTKGNQYAFDHYKKVKQP